MEWIDVKDQVPRELSTVLVFHKKWGPVVCLVRYWSKDDDGEWYSYDPDSFTVEYEPSLEFASSKGGIYLEWGHENVLMWANIKDPDNV